MNRRCIILSDKFCLRTCGLDTFDSVKCPTTGRLLDASTCVGLYRRAPNLSALAVVGPVVWVEHWAHAGRVVGHHERVVQV